MFTPSNRPALGRLLPFSCLFVSVLCPLIAPGQGADLNRPSDITLLEAGKSVEREMAGAQKHSYQLTLTEGQFAAVELDTRSIRATIILFDTTGEVVIAYPATLGKQTVDLVAEATGLYRIDIASKPSEAQAGAYTIGPTTINPAPEKELWRHQARALSYRANTLIAAGKYDEALVLAEKALVLREKALGPESVGVANSLHMLASLYHAKGDYPKAVSSLLRAMAIYEKISGPMSDGLFRTLGNLGSVYLTMGDLDKAEQFFQRGLEMQEKLSGADDPLVAYSLNNLAIVNRERGDYGKAETLYQRALTISEKAHGPDHLRLAALLSNLSSLSQDMGDYVKAETYGQRALSIREKTQGPEHPDLFSPLINLGNVQYRAGELGKAEILYQRALQISTKALGPEHPNVALALNNLAEIHRDRREFAQAEKLFEEALAILIKKFGENNSDVAAQLNNLGNLYRDQGDYSRAELFYKRALASREKLLGPEHPDVVNTLANTALMHMARGSFAEAASFQSRAIAISERNTDLNLVTGSERQKLAYLDLLSEQIDRAITLNVSFAPDNAAARTLAVTTVLQRKGRVQDALSDSRAALQRQLSTTDAELIDRFNKLTSRLARLVLGGPQRLTTEEHQKQIRALREERENLEGEISRSSARFRAQSRPVTIEAVQAVLPQNAALLEFIAYNKLLPKGITAKERRGESRYAVYIIRGRGDVLWKDLGETKPIDDAVDALRRALRDPNRNDVTRLARSLDEKVMRPVRALAGDATHLLVSPDGALNLIPFEALVDEENSYLVERYSFSYLTSGRDLLGTSVERQSKSQPLIIANPLFGEPAGEPTVSAGTSSKIRRAKSRRASITSTRSITDTYFAPLSGTSLEASTIKKLFPNAISLTADLATETSVKQAVAPSILHLATHGFFLNEEAATAPSAAKSSPKVENPLLRSGLALAGANKHAGSGDDGILTALEASGLNLWGTKLVVLSACDTGIGEVRNGEGVYGLRRSFQIAGAESLVMSLWPVSDYVTRELMTNYYKNLKLGAGRGESLRKVQLEMLKRPSRRHPFYWASFIQSGEWANLDGKR